MRVPLCLVKGLPVHVLRIKKTFELCWPIRDYKTYFLNKIYQIRNYGALGHMFELELIYT